MQCLWSEYIPLTLLSIWSSSLSSGRRSVRRSTMIRSEKSGNNPERKLSVFMKKGLLQLVWISHFVTVLLFWYWSVKVRWSWSVLFVFLTKQSQQIGNDPEDDHYSCEDKEILEECADKLSFVFCFDLSSFFSFRSSFIYLLAGEIKDFFDRTGHIDINVVSMFDIGILDIVVVYRFFNDECSIATSYQERFPCDW